MTLSMAEEANAFSVGDNRACSNGGSGKNKYSGKTRVRTRCGSSFQMGPLYDGSGQGEELLCLWSFRHIAHHCRNRKRGRVMEERRVEYGRGRIKEIHEHSNNLKGVENLELLN